MIEALAHEWISGGGNNFNLAILILASVNLFAAVLTILSIFYNAWTTKESDFHLQTRYVFSLSRERERERTPLRMLI